MANEAFKNLVEKVDTVEELLNETRMFVFKDEFSNQKIIRKKLEVTGTFKSSGTEAVFNNDKVAFFNVTPVAQQALISDASMSTVSDAGDTTNNSAINTNLAELETKVNAILDILEAFGFMSST